MKKAVVLFLAFLVGGVAAFFFSDAGKNGMLFGGGEPIVIPALPQPQLVRSYIPPSQVSSSHLTIPVQLSMMDLQLLTNRNLLRQYNGDVEYLDGVVKGKLNYRLRREEDAKVTAENGRIRVALPVNFQVRFTGSVLAAIVRVPFSAQTDGAIDITLTIQPGIRRDWSINTDPQVDFTWVKSPKLNVAGISIGLQKESERFLREAIRDNIYKVDDVINKEVKLRELMQREWDNLTVPIKAADSIFLHFDPRGIAASPLVITPEEVTLRACVETGISLSMGLEDVAPTRKKHLPPLEQDVPEDEAVNLNVKALLNYDALEQEAAEALSGSEVDLGIASVTVKSLNLMGSGEKLIAAFEIAARGSSGTIYAAGEPYFDEETRVLSIKNFDLDEGTRDGLIQTAAWLLRPALVEFLGEKLEWELGPAIDKLADEARAILTSYDLSDEIELKGTLQSAKLDGLRVTDQGIEIGVNLEGTAALTYIPLY